jgi:hypothetical protein
MSKASTILSRLKMTAKPAAVSSDPVIARREKLLVRLQEQREMALCFVDGKAYTATWQKTVVDAETGAKKIEEVPRRVKAWFSGAADKMLLEVRYGNVLVELAPGQNAIEVGAAAKLEPTIDTVIEAVAAGEVDELLTSITKKPTAK